jgi:(5-formylfuran-3-yl)methyl phosphate synthase
MTLLLASVRSADEALTACAGGADIIDLKEPAAGALGRLPDATIAAVLRAVAGRKPTSATIGDMPLEPHRVRGAVLEMAATGVDIVKLGVFAGDAPATLAALAEPARDGIRLVAVFFADQRPDLDILPQCADAGFFGVMLDTADKRAGPLTRHLAVAALARFVADARRHGLLVGLAGSLSAAEVPALLPLAPDYLGFRSALAVGGRSGPLDAVAVAKLRLALGQAPLASSATATAGAQSAALAAIGAVRASISSSNPR